MTYISLDVDVDDFIHDIPTRALIEEIEHRRNVGGDAPTTTNRELAQRLRSTYFRRDASQFEALLVTYLDPIEIKREEHV